ncbi:hypothetical protein [Streptomyces sp. NPDC045251]|uniref:hypothetical protein n=1 Tax=unclassified Streptomyces TaxID=2593676 RepID=UPI0033DACC91
MRKRLITAAATTAALAALTTVGIATTASASAPAAYSAGTTYYGSAKAGTGGLILRDKWGNPTASGISEGTRFTIATTCVRTRGVDLIKVHQIEPGGWGSSYTGYVKRQYANVPPSLPC